MNDTKQALLKKRKKFTLSPKHSLSTGSTLLNLACTDTPNCGFIKGCYYFLVGDSTSGKTWISMTCFAESQLNPAFKDYEIHLDDVERGTFMDIGHYFGARVARKLQVHHSETVQAFYRRIWDLIKSRKRFIYVLDSQDALDSESATKKFRQQKKASESGEKAAGSYGDGKAKFHSENIRWVLSGLRKTGSILIIIGQTRDNVGNPFSFEKKTRSGGKALRFYANIEIWTSVGRAIKKTVRGKSRVIGTNCIAEVRKNRVSGKIGKERSAVIPIYQGHGIDDTGSLVDFLIEEKQFRDEGEKRYRVPDLDFVGTRSEIISFFEDEDASDFLRETAAKVWREIEDECQLVNRKRRYE